MHVSKSARAVFDSARSDQIGCLTACLRMMAGGTPQGSFAQGPHRGLNTACVSCGPMRCLILKIRFRLQSGLQTVLFGKESTWVFGVTNGPKSVRHMYSSLRAKSDCQSEVSRINKTEVIKRQQKNEKRFGSKRLCSALRFAPSGHTSNTIRVKVFPVFFTFSWVVFRPLELARRRKSHSQRLAVSKNFLVYKKIPKFGVSSCYFSSGRTRSRTGEPLEMPAVE